MEIVPQIESSMHFIVNNIETLTNPSGQINGNDFLLELIQWLSHTIWIQKWPQLLDPHRFGLEHGIHSKNYWRNCLTLKLSSNNNNKYTQMNAANEQNSNEY